MNSFDTFPRETLQFLTDLEANNTKAWFSAHKSDFDAYIKTASEAFARALTAAVQDLTGVEHGYKVFRIYRDVRFSKDKTPYNPHIRLALTPLHQNGQPPMWFFGMSPRGVALGCGVFQFEKTALAHFRTAAAGPFGEELITLAADLRGRGIRIAEPELKRVPAGYDKDHANGEALRYKGFAGWVDKPNPDFATRPKLVSRTVAQFDGLMPVFSLLMRLN